MKLKNAKIHKGTETPWLWLNENENEAEAEKCTCALVRNYNNGGPAMFLCPEHEAGPQLLAALKNMVNDGWENDEVRKAKARAAIAKAEGK